MEYVIFCRKSIYILGLNSYDFLAFCGLLFWFRINQVQLAQRRVLDLSCSCRYWTLVPANHTPCHICRKVKLRSYLMPTWSKWRGIRTSLSQGSKAWPRPYRNFLERPMMACIELLIHISRHALLPPFCISIYITFGPFGVYK